MIMIMITMIHLLEAVQHGVCASAAPLRRRPRVRLPRQRAVIGGGEGGQHPRGQRTGGQPSGGQHTGGDKCAPHVVHNLDAALRALCRSGKGGGGGQVISGDGVFESRPRGGGRGVDARSHQVRADLFRLI
jgi:hypothetical protein